MEKQEALDYARKFLGGSWLKLGVDDVDVRPFGSGYSSRLFLCEQLSNQNEGEQEDDKKTPQKFLIRLFGGKFISKEELDEFEALTHPAQAVLYLVQGQLGYGPKLYGVFEGGRLEEYIPSSTLNDDHLQDPIIRKEVAQRIARYHALDLPFSRENKSGLDIVLSSYRRKFVKEEFLTNETVKESGADLDFLTSLDVEAEANWLSGMQKKVGGRIALCLRDLNRLNCLVRDEPDKHNERVTMIDYEASLYTWRGVDIGSHFSMWMFDLTQPEFKAKIGYPSEEIQREYVRNYLEETKKLAYFEFDDKIDSEDHLLMEAHFHGMLGMFFFATITLTAYKKDTAFVTKEMIHLFLRCSERSLKFYMERKQQFIEKYQL